MHTFSPQEDELIKALNCKVRWSSRGPTVKSFVYFPDGAKPVLEPANPAGDIVCEVFDRSVPNAPHYAEGWGNSKAAALTAALAAAKTAVKPMTPGQKYMAALEKAKLDAKDIEIAELRKRLEEKGGEVPEAVAPAAVEAPPAPKSKALPDSPSIKRDALLAGGSKPSTR